VDVPKSPLGVKAVLCVFDAVIPLLRSAAIRRASSRVSKPLPFSGLALEVDIGECLPVAVTDDVGALVVLFDVPGELWKLRHWPKCR
jgi:hypothetical protein